MRSLSTALLGVALFLTIGPSLRAQESMQLQSGARVRLTSAALPPDQRVVQIVSTSNDTVLFRSDRSAETRSLALSEITAVDVSLGQRRQTRNGAVIGLTSGFLIGGLLGYATYEECTGWCFFGPNTRGDAFLWGGTAGGALGLVAGTVIGFATKSEKWKRVQPNTRITVARLREGGGVSISYAF